MSYSLTGTSIQDPAINRDPDPTKHIPVTFSQPRIITSRIFPSIYYNTKNASLDPTNGKSLFLGVSVSGSVLGGDVNTIAPQLDFQYFKPLLRRRSEKPQVLAMRFKADHIRAYGSPPPIQQGDTRSLSFIGGIPIFERFFLGGEYDIRGYNLRTIGPIVTGTTYASTRGPITPKMTDPNDSTKLVDYTGPLNPNVLNQFVFQAPQGNCAGLFAPDLSKGCNTAITGAYPSLIGGDTEVVYNIEYRVPIFSVLSVAAFADVGTAFNARKYNDQITSSNFVFQNITPSGVIINPQGLLATTDEINSVKDASGNLPAGYTTVFMYGQSQRFDIVHNSQSKLRLPDDIRSSVGLEFRVQMPVINVPFRLIMAYNPNVDNTLTSYIRERRTVIRFSVGRTF
jgi:outer membrane protein insertion porin family